MSRLHSRVRNEQGMALIGVILLLILASGVCAALAVSGRTETMAAYNNDASAQAHAAAQAGLTAAIEVVIDNLNASALTPTEAVNVLLVGPDGDAAATADNGSLASFGLPGPGATAALGAQLCSGTPCVRYSVQVYDEDDPNRGITLDADALDEIDEDATGPTTDGNKKLVIRATGFGRNNTSVTLEAIIGTTTLPALVTNGDLDVQGNLTLVGQNGGVHANGNLTIGSGSTDIAEDATASGIADIHATADVGGLEASGQPTKTVPSVSAMDYYAYADYLLDDDGLIKNAQTLVPLCALATCEALFGWSYDGGSDWSLNNNTVTNGTYYCKGTVRMSGSPGTPLAPAVVSILAEGDIDIQGNPDLQPDAQLGFEILFVTDGDLQISGDLATPLIVEGVILVHGQLQLGGSPSIAGQILVEDTPGAGSLVLANVIAGTPTITYNGTAGNDTFDIAGWREVK